MLICLRERLSVLKKRDIIILIFLYSIYFIGIILKVKTLGNIIAPILVFINSYFVYKYIYRKQSVTLYQVSSFMLFLGIFFWAIFEFMWGISEVVFHMNPERNAFICNGYSLTNFFFLIAISIFCYAELKYWNKIQMYCDCIIITICIGVLVWLFLLKQNIDNGSYIINNIVFMLTLISDIIIITISSIISFSERQKKLFPYLKLTILGIFVFAISDFIFYYIYNYKIYQPNSFIDGLYIISFSVIGISALLRERLLINFDTKRTIHNKKRKFGKELSLIISPLIIVIFSRDSIQYLLMIVSCIMIYYLFTNYIQKNIFRDELLKKEKEYNEELKLMVEERTKDIIRLMKKDSITGLYSRQHFDETLNKICIQLEKDERILLFYIEMNKYKMIKSMYGKYITENLLKDLGERLNQIAMSEKEELLAAYGDDIFTVALKGSYTNEQEIEIAENIIHLCSDVYHIDEYDIAVTLNIGIACYPQDAKTSEELIKNADTAMMQARTNGFNKCLIFNELLGQSVYNKSIIEIWLKKVNINEEFRLVYQPQVLCEDGTLIGFEALARWRTKTGKTISPIEFIPIAEETGIIISMGYWIFEQAISQLAKWQESSLKNLRVAINVSVKQLNDKELVPRLKSLLQSKKVSPENIEIEITENIQLEKDVEITNVLCEISKLGISIAIDDFGTGYSSLHYLKKLPIKRLKIAKELIDHIEQDLTDYTIAKAVISIGKTQGFKVIAEGVETKEQWECLKLLECDEIQGYFFAKPMEVDEITTDWI